MRIVMAAFAGTVRYDPRGSPPANTVIFPNAGMYFLTGSSKPNLPSSHKVNKPATVKGWLMPYSLKSESSLIASSADDAVLKNSTLPLRATKHEAKGKSSLPTNASIHACTRLRRSRLMPAAIVLVFSVSDKGFFERRSGS